MVDRKSVALGATSVLGTLVLGLVLGTPVPGEVVAPPVVVPAAAVAAVETARADPHTHAGWEQRLERQDELLVEQAVKAGCDEERAAKLRALFAAKEAARASAIADFESGKISEAELQETAHVQRKGLETALQKLLAPPELEALDPVAARAQVAKEQGKKRR